MQIAVKMAIMAAALYIPWFTFGQLYIRGKVGSRMAAVLGAMTGVVSGTILGWPDYQPRAPTVGAIIAATVIGAVVVGVLVAAMPHLGLPLPPKK